MMVKYFEENNAVKIFPILEEGCLPLPIYLSKVSLECEVNHFSVHQILKGNKI